VEDDTDENEAVDELEANVLPLVDRGLYDTGCGIWLWTFPSGICWR